jgi:hypothetical protein
MAEPTAESEHAAVQGPLTEREASMPLLTALQQLLHDKYADREFGYEELYNAGTTIFGQPLRTNGTLHLKLELGDGIAYQTLSRQVRVHGIKTHGKYRVIWTAEQREAAAAAAAEAEAKRVADSQQSAAKEAASLEPLKQFADVPQPGADLNGPRELHMERRRLELRVSDRYQKVLEAAVSNMDNAEGLACEHYVQPVEDHSEAYLRILVKFDHPLKKSPAQAFKLLGKAIDMTVLPELEAETAKQKAAAEAKAKLKQGGARVSHRQCLEQCNFFRILTGYAYAVPEDGTFYDIAGSLQHQIYEFRTDSERGRAKRKSVTTDAQGKELTQKAWKDKIVELTDTITSLESEIERQKGELEALSVFKDWELQEDGTMVKVEEPLLRVDFDFQ